MVIINIRTESKLKTRSLIIKNTKHLLLEYGLLKTTTKIISEKCSVSHGTIFLHFQTKENLFNELLISNIVELENTLKMKCDTSKKASFFVNKLLDTVSKYEDLLSRIYKDEVYLSNEVSQAIDSYENTLKNLILDNHRNNSKTRVSIVDVFVMIDAFLSQLRFYLVKKEYSPHSVSLIKQKKGRILKLYNLLFESGKND